MYRLATSPTSLDLTSFSSWVEEAASIVMAFNVDFWQSALPKSND